MYQDLSREPDSGDECSSQNMHGRRIDDTASNSNNEQEESETNGIRYNSSYQCIKRQKFHRADKSNEGSTGEIKIYENKKESWNGQDKAQQMMQKMGYKEGHGLGKHKQGRLEPVEAAKQLGRRGLGHHIPGLEDSSRKWDSIEEEVKVVEPMEWLKNLHHDLPTFDELTDWLQKGPKKLIIDDETHFCDEDIVTNVVNSKSVFDNLDSIEMRNARRRCNPYETIYGAFFLNRAAVKMANIDRACNFMFTKPNGLQNNELLYFADVCAGPGGFSEYVLWRKKWRAKGFGFTLKNENDFKLDDFYVGPCETFHPYYGPKDNGDVFDSDNQKAFRDLIMTHTNRKGVHFMMADGGFSVNGQDNLQEILLKRLYLCQCLVALMIVREKGHFVTKLFDLFTPFSAGLVYLMYRCFDEVSIFKPNSSRPANSERYLICKTKRPGTEHIAQHLEHINHILSKNEDNNDVLQLVSFEALEREQSFVQYLRQSNNYLGRKQITGLRKIAAFCEDTNLVESRQADIRKECLKYWGLPDLRRTIPKQMKPQEKLMSLFAEYTGFLSKSPVKLTKDNVEGKILNQPLNWYCVPCGTGPDRDEKKTATFYLGMGRSKIYRYVKGSWAKVDDIKIELPPDTLLYGETVYEMTRENKYQRKLQALHIIDAFFLGTEDISRKSLKDRHELAKKFCEALWKPDGSNYDRIRTKDLFPLLPKPLEKLCVKERLMKNNQPALVYEFTKTYLDSINDKSYFIPNSVLFLKSIASPWTRNFSRTHSRLYYYNNDTRASLFESQKPDKANASFIETFSDMVIWYWPRDDLISVEDLIRCSSKKCPQSSNPDLTY
ncbi:PREDICTED: cap-specific mRNA (nucleoside-2'-O-)-methyltransferase 1 [Dufourea novaeangliae]|uniref:Cap-specific mRNA (nucleoside-2'-O-)-methyltransferase 1 n=1 Tax=Dufourea novaeangliae TaxID=178035 RepID=A0A154P6Z3_DUFNO|nr:PREDICTED: cap-specific mRNA (nucleoside-2'-O-)-methyltransferase 1 [Dufourea novaeangliae]KZC07705.1 Cap-specific mRNA (nucleoside-2'-O-)-methyltransferase 1 [Dufourea novaeangliae]